LPSILRTSPLINPRDELAPARMTIVHDESGSVSFDLIERQSDSLRIEFGVVEKREAAEPLKVLVACERASKPVRHAHLY
jgi:hypothetical protein